MSTLLYDENEVIKFLESTIPKLEDDEVLMLGLAVRGKYCSDIEKSGTIINSLFIKNDNVDDIFMKIRRLSYVEKCYRSKKTGNYIDPKCMAMYIDLQPRSVINGMNKFIKSYIDKLNEKVLNINAFDNTDIKKFISWIKMRSAIAKSISRNVYCDIDIDIKDYELLRKIVSFIRDIDPISSVNMKIIETKNGFHVIVPNDKKIVSEVYRLHMYFEGVEIHNKQCQIPIPGTYQGGFKVKLITGDLHEI